MSRFSFKQLSRVYLPFLLLGAAFGATFGSTGCGDDVTGVATGTAGQTSVAPAATNSSSSTPNPGKQGAGDATGNATDKPNNGGTGPKAPCVGVDPEGPGLYRAREQHHRSAATTGSESSTDTPSADSGTSPDTSTQSDDSGTGSHGCETPGCVGDMTLIWELHDYQPLSCGYGKAYGYPDFAGKPIMVVFLAGWCSYCHGQASGLERMRLELKQAGHVFNFAIVNMAGANSVENRQKLLDRTSIPLFQDTDFTDFAGRLKAHKDEMFLYDARGVLRETFLHEDTRSSNLSTPEGYNLVRDSFVKVIKG